MKPFTGCPCLIRRNVSPTAFFAQVYYVFDLLYTMNYPQVM